MVHIYFMIFCNFLFQPSPINSQLYILQHKKFAFYSALSLRQSLRHLFVGDVGDSFLPINNPFLQQKEDAPQSTLFPFLYLNLNYLSFN